MTVRAAGPLGKILSADSTTVKEARGYQLGAGANPLVVLRRTAFLDSRGAIDRDSVKGLLRWAAGQRLGQQPDLLRAAAARREAALASTGLVHERLLARPTWHLAVGHGDHANAHEVGLAMHGTYGCPIIPGSTLKGLSRAFAALPGADPDTRVTTVLGPPPASSRDEKGPAGGTVSFLDALLAGRPVDVAVDVLTPHVQEYYTDVADDRVARPHPPGEYHNPRPVEFLVVTGSAFAVDIVGRSSVDVGLAARWCAAAVDELGVGGKTAAGYGYLAIDESR